MSNRLFGSDDDSDDFIHGDLDADVDPYPPSDPPEYEPEDDDLDFWNAVEQGFYDDDPSPYDGNYSEM